MKDKKFCSVQYMRGVAALFVVIAHASAHPLAVAPVWTWISGRIGVTLFFVISGFIMVVVTGSGRFDPVRFLKSRIYRIVPLYWTITLVAAAAAYLAPSLFHKTIFDPIHLLASLFFVPMLRPGNPGMIEPFVKLGWTLNYEMFFYLVFMSMFFLSAWTRTIVLLAFFTALTAVGQIFAPEQTLLKFYTSYDLFAFAAGCGIGVIHQRGGFEQVVAGQAVILGAVCFLAILLVFLLSETKEPRLDRQLVFTVLSTGLLVAGLVLERSGMLRPYRLPMLIGDASYSIYLAHMFAIGTVTAAAGKFFGTSVTWLEYGATVGTGAISGIGFGVAVFLAVERPFIQLLSQRRTALVPRTSGPNGDEASPTAGPSVPNSEGTEMMR